MGKISKALEKAHKAQKPAALTRKLDGEVIDNSADAGEIAQLDRHPLNSDLLHLEVDPTTTTEEPKLFENSRDTFKTGFQPSSINKWGGGDQNQENAGETDTHQNIIVARSTPEEYSHPYSTVPMDDRRKDSKYWQSNATEERKRIKVQYSKTKVQLCDPEKLKDNKVLSIFEDIETTNQFKILRTQVLRKLKALGGNSILVTSANPCEGKTFTSINLGVSIAKEFDRTVLIIDADIRRPLKQHTDFSTEFFSLNVEKGLTDYLEGEADIEDILINPGIDKLTLIPGGMPVDNSPELLNSARMEKMMAELKSRYAEDRLVILDGPAILHYPDAMILYKYVDGVLPVIESERTSTESVKKMMERLTEVNILGAVMNKNRG